MMPGVKALTAGVLMLLVGCMGTLKEKASVCLGFCVHAELESSTQTKEGIPREKVNSNDSRTDGIKRERRNPVSGRRHTN